MIRMGTPADLKRGSVVVFKNGDSNRRACICGYDTGILLDERMPDLV